MTRYPSIVSIPRPFQAPALGVILAAIVVFAPPASTFQNASKPAAPAVRLREVAASAGLTFVHQHSPTPEKHYVEAVPGGLAVFDYNGDGRPDIFFTNGAQTPSLDKASPALCQPLVPQRWRHEVHRRHGCRRRARRGLFHGSRRGRL